MKKSLHPKALLLKYQGYPPAIAFALLLHGIIAYFLLERALVPEQFVDVEQPTFVNASVIQENPQRQQRQQELEQQRRAQEQARQRAQEEEAARARAEEEARQQAEREQQRQAQAREEQRQQELAAQRAREEEAEREQEEAERQERERQERERQEQLAREQARREAEAARQAEAQRQAEQAAADAGATQAYSAIIHDAVARNWSVPPSARNGMSVLLEIRLVPTGEVVSVNVLQSSGDAAFDRSAVQAVRKTQRFPELQQMPIGLFEREFRQFNLLFRPEDLLR